METKPEIDPELAELESGARPKVNWDAKKIVDTVLARGFAKQSNRGRTDPGSKGTRDKRRARGQGRAVRRAMERRGQAPDIRDRPHARLGGAKLVKSEVQRASEERREIRAYLSRVKVIRLLVECPEAKWVVSVPGIRNVWQLAQAPTDTIRSIPGLGPARRLKLRAYLISKNVPVAWEA